MSNFSFNPLLVAIKPLYEQAIAQDELFAQEVKEKESRAEKPKSLAECAEYIWGEAYAYAKEHKVGNAGLAACEDSQITAMIKHYYDEDDIKIQKVSNATASVSTTGSGKSAGKATEKVSSRQRKQPTKKKKPERPKETLDCVNVPMIRPASERDAKKASRDQAKAVVVMDLGLWGDEEER